MQYDRDGKRKRAQELKKYQETQTDKHIMDIGEQVSDDDAPMSQQEAREVTKILSADDINKQIKQLESEMLEIARDLEFEKAAKVRDKIHQLHQDFINA